MESVFLQIWVLIDGGNPCIADAHASSAVWNGCANRLLTAPFRDVILPDVSWLFKQGWLVLALFGVATTIAGSRIGDIEFFGYKGLDVSTIRKALRVHEGGEYSDRTKDQVRQAIAGVIGKEPTDVAAICCDEKGNRLLFIGLPGASYKRFTYNPEPKGKERLPSDITILYGRLDHALRRLSAEVVRQRRKTTRVVTHSSKTRRPVA